jgi:Uma2 family endonuclease
MKTALHIGPADRGREMTLEEFEHSEWEEGYRYELIDGRLYVSPHPNFPENYVAEWVGLKLRLFAISNPSVINYVSSAPRVFVPGRRRVTNPEPDVAAYHNFPLERDHRQTRWQDVSPILVVEVLSLDDPEKDLQRNVDLYLQVPSIKEYWLFDNRDTAECPFFRVHRRHGKTWRTGEYRMGEIYATKLFPGFKLHLDPRR